MSNAHAFFRAKDVPFVLGHRGVPLLHQENTMASFRKARELGVDGIELDVFMTKDEQIVVFHDEETSRLTGVKGKIADMTWDEVSKLRIQRILDNRTFPSEERIPLLEEVLSEFKGKLLINIEMKAYVPKWERRHTGTEVARIVRKTGAQDSVVATSFDFFMLHCLEQEQPGLHSGFAYDLDMVKGVESIVDKWLTFVPALKDLHEVMASQSQHDAVLFRSILESNMIGSLIGSTVVDIEHGLADEDAIDSFHQKKMLVGAYTLLEENCCLPAQAQEDAVRRLAKNKVDWLETDDPERMLKLLHG